MLSDLRDHIDSSEKKYISNLNYCIKMIQSNKLFEAEFESCDEIEQSQIQNEKRPSKEVVQWYNNFSSQQQKRISGTSPNLIHQSVFSEEAAELPLESLINLNEAAKDQMKKIETLDFDIFEVKKETNSNELLTVATFLLHKHKIFSKFKIQVETFMYFIAKIQTDYKDISYHNKTHGADVCQTVYYFLFPCKFSQKAQLDDLDITAILIAASCHDFEHPGLNNLFLIETKHQLALRYNDVSILENHHVASTFALLNQDKYNILKNLSKDDFKRFRKLMIGCILETDMSKHFSD